MKTEAFKYLIFLMGNTQQRIGPGLGPTDRKPWKVVQTHALEQFTWVPFLTPDVLAGECEQGLYGPSHLHLHIICTGVLEEQMESCLESI